MLLFIFAENNTLASGHDHRRIIPLLRPINPHTNCGGSSINKITGVVPPYINAFDKTELVNKHTISNPRANGAKRRSGRKPGARVTNSALAFTYIRIMRCYIAQWHSGIKSRPIFWIWTLDGFRCFAHARVSSS